MKYSVSLFFCLFLTTLPAQTLNDFTAPTDQHQLIKGTNVYIIPPPGFVVSENFKGFQNPDDPMSMIMLMEIPAPISVITEGFTAETMSSRGMELLHKDKVEITGLIGYCIGLDQGTNGVTFTKTLIAYGNEEGSTLVNGISLKDSMQLNEQIQKAIKSVFVDHQLNVDPREGLSFTLDESAGELKFVSVVGNAILLNRTGGIDAENPELVNLIVDKSFQQVDVLDRKGFCLDRLEQYPESYELRKGNKPLATQLAGLEGYELYAINRDNRDESIYQLVLFPEEGGYYIFLGDYPTKDKQAIKQIKQVIETFSVK